MPGRAGGQKNPGLMNAAIIGTTDVISPVAAGPAAGADRPVVDKEAGLDAIVENFDGFVWSINHDFQYIVLNSALRKKIKELLPAGILARQDIGAGYFGQLM
jgi:hypothetical protein